MDLENNTIEKLIELKVPFVVLTFYVTANMENEKRKKINEISHIEEKTIIRRLEKGIDLYKYDKYKVMSNEHGIVYEFNNFKEEFNKLTTDVKNVYLNNRKFLQSLHSANHF